MERFIGQLILVSTAAGLVWVFLLGWWMFGRARFTTFKRLAAVFMFAGAVVPLVMLPVWFWLNRHPTWRASGGFEELVTRVWPTSIVLMALDSPTPVPWSTIIFVYAFSILGNVGAYGAVGLIVSWLYVRLRRARAL